MHLPRRYYRNIARALVDNPNNETAQAAVSAINDLLEERAHLVLKLVNQKPSKDTSEKSKTWWQKLFG
jgi:hypothetical protein